MFRRYRDESSGHGRNQVAQAGLSIFNKPGDKGNVGPGRGRSGQSPPREKFVS